MLDHERRQVFDLPALRLSVTEHQAEIKCCPVSGRKVSAAFPPGVLAPVQYGPHFRGLTLYLLHQQLVNRPIQRRDDAPTAMTTHNLERVELSWFQYPDRGDLRLRGVATAVIDQGQALPGFANDLDGHSRPQGLGWDIGADEFSSAEAPP